MGIGDVSFDGVFRSIECLGWHDRSATVIKSDQSNRCKLFT